MGVGLFILTYTLAIAEPEPTPCNIGDPQSLGPLKGFLLGLIALPLLGAWAGMFRSRSPKAFLSAVRGVTIWSFLIGFPTMLGLASQMKGDVTSLTQYDLPALFLLLSQLTVFLAALACLSAVRMFQKVSLWYGYGKTVLYALILGLIFGLFMPAISGGQISVNQSGAVRNLIALYKGQENYASNHPDQGYAPKLEWLLPSEEGNPRTEQNSGVIDELLVSGEKCGYRFTFVPGMADEEGRISSYTLRARPLIYGTTGHLSYFIDESRVMRYTWDGRAATAEDSPYGG